LCANQNDWDQPGEAAAIESQNQCPDPAGTLSGIRWQSDERAPSNVSPENLASEWVDSLQFANRTAAGWSWMCFGNCNLSRQNRLSSHSFCVSGVQALLRPGV